MLKCSSNPKTAASDSHGAARDIAQLAQSTAGLQHTPVLRRSLSPPTVLLRATLNAQRERGRRRVRGWGIYMRRVRAAVKSALASPREARNATAALLRSEVHYALLVSCSTAAAAARNRSHRRPAIVKPRLALSRMPTSRGAASSRRNASLAPAAASPIRLSAEATRRAIERLVRAGSAGRSDTAPACARAARRRPCRCATGCISAPSRSRYCAVVIACTRRLYRGAATRHQLCSLAKRRDVVRGNCSSCRACRCTAGARARARATS